LSGVTVPQDAVLLMALVVGLYLYDSTLLLRRDEGVLMPARRGRWSVGLGSHSYQLLGKYVFIPNPFLPHRPLFRASWRFEGDVSAVQENWEARRNALRPVAPTVGGMAVAFFVLLPLGFFTRLGDWALLAAIALLYLSIVAALAWTWKNRSTFELSGKQFAALAFESVVCSPFALNLIRSLSAHMPVREDLVSASRRLQTTDDWQATRRRLVARLDEAIEVAEEGSERMAGLLEHRRRMTEQ
jgi:hypothetical protein